jgi:hypothetical protein
MNLGTPGSYLELPWTRVFSGSFDDKVGLTCDEKNVGCGQMLILRTEGK